MKEVVKRVFSNYDSLIFTHHRYQEYAYNDSSKEILGAVQINALHRKSGLSIFSHKRNRQSANFLLSGSMYQKRSDLGSVGVLENIFGGNAYSYPELDRVSGLRADEISPVKRSNTIFSIYTTMKNCDVHWEVKDTICNHVDCYLLRAIQKITFEFDEKKDQYSESEIQKRREAAGDWDTCYQKTVLTDIINKSDYAILFSCSRTVCINKTGQYRTSLMIDKYRKTGNYYYLEYFEIRFPRFFPGYRGGLNDKNLYSLVIGESSDAKIDQNKEKEMRIDKMKRIKSNEKYNDFLERKSSIDPDILKYWDQYWQEQREKEKTGEQVKM